MMCVCDMTRQLEAHQPLSTGRFQYSAKVGGLLVRRLRIRKVANVTGGAAELKGGLNLSFP